MKILLLSAYDAASHRSWRAGLVQNLQEHTWTVLTLPPRFFAWRSRGNALTLAFEQKNTLQQDYGLVLATSMTDLAELKGITPSLAGVPAIVYFHENQFAYPERRQRKEYQNYKLTNLYTALAADRVLFNSRYNMNTFCEGVGGLLSLMPDHVPHGVVEAIIGKAGVLPVPLEETCYMDRPANAGPLTLVWNHRWEHDKAPERFFQALFNLQERGVPFKVHVVGQQFRDRPQIFGQARKRLAERILTWGFVEEEGAYRALLASSDLVVSTAAHDFQGLAVLEGAAAGCLPVVPDRLAYPEFFPKSYRYPSFEDAESREIDALSEVLERLCRDPERARRRKVPDVRHLSWPNMAGEYREIIKAVSGV